VDPSEIGKFSALAADWWDPAGKFAALHRLNPLRLRFIRDEASKHFGRDPGGFTPFAGLSLVDVGCGGGLLSEPMARLGFDVLGIDAADESVTAAAEHARAANVGVAYRRAAVETLAAQGSSFDVVLSMEVVEHVADVQAFLESCAAVVRPGGLMLVATMNKTIKALALAKMGAEYILGWVPRGTHDWRKFVTPESLREQLGEAGLEVLKFQGVIFDPLAWNWRLSANTDVNYMCAAAKSNSVSSPRRDPAAAEPRPRLPRSTPSRP
jgi:2-polyprenyl-6-hydroxyphenyl methylase/3-demethylubiquinone-9 3-methyltransferase